MDWMLECWGQEETDYKVRQSWLVQNLTPWQGARDKKLLSVEETMAGAKSGGNARTAMADGRRENPKARVVGRLEPRSRVGPESHPTDRRLLCEKRRRTLCSRSRRGGDGSAVGGAEGRRQHDGPGPLTRRTMGS